MTELTRRDFFRKSTALTAGAALAGGAGIASAGAQTPPRIRRYKPFGNTGFMVGDISSGSGQREPGFVQHLYDRGINLIDSARQYGSHEEVIGRSWENIPREKMFIISKWAPRFVNAEVTKEELLQDLDVTLERLNTSYVDCMMIHSIGSPNYGGMERIQNPAIYEAWDEAKKLGKMRFTGASSHNVRMIEEIGWGVDNDRFEVILLGANFLTRGLEPLLKKARAKGIATIAMKTMTIYKSDLNIRELQNREINARQAVIKWILASDLFDTMVIGMGNYDRVDEYLTVSGTTSLTAEDRDNLDTVAAHVSPMYCRPGCGDCYGSCPYDVPVSDVLRNKMYFENYGEEKKAMAFYSELPERNSAAMCSTCSAPCETACSFNLPVRARMLEAHRQLTLA